MTHRIIKLIIGSLLMFLVVSAVVMLLWNWLMPEILGINKISFIQAAGLLLLSKILFGGFNREHWKNKMSQSHWESKFVNNKTDYPLSQEQKTILREKFKNKWCSYQKDEENQNVQV